jgi:multidrug efflux pump subunit AcrB
LTVSDIADALRAQNNQYAAGKIGAEPAIKGQSLVYTVTARGRLVEPQEFGEVVIRSTAGGGVLRLKDVARVELGAQSYDTYNLLSGKPSIGMAVFMQSGGNALEVAQAVRDKMNEMKKSFPTGVDFQTPFDPTRYVSASIEEVTKTILEAGALVILVVFLFLQTWRATLIPVIAVPVSLIGTFAGLWLVGFSINTLTLFAMVLSIGIVIDDAIVVLENVERLMREEKMTPLAAAIEAMREVSSAIIAIVLVLCAVFVPVAFLTGSAHCCCTTKLTIRNTSAGSTVHSAQRRIAFSRASVRHCSTADARSPSSLASSPWPDCCSGICRTVSCRPRTRAT